MDADMNIAMILSGGNGTRLGSDIPKQYISVKGRMIITHCLQVFGGHSEIDAIQIVAHEQWHDEIFGQMPETALEKFRGFSMPGSNRQRSIFHGLQDIMQYAEKSDIVIIHDAVRPLVSEAMLSACTEACKEYEGVMPVLPMKDTVYLGSGSKVISLLERDQVYAGQAPEAFLIGKYYEANERLMPDQIDLVHGSTEPAVMAGMDMAMIPGDEGNFKITTRMDLERFEMMLDALEL